MVGDTPLNPVKIRAAMARGGIAPMQLQPWWSPDTDRQVQPLKDAEIQAEVWKFVGWLWAQCLQAEALTMGQDDFDAAHGIDTEWLRSGAGVADD